MKVQFRVQHIFLLVAALAFLILAVKASIIGAIAKESEVEDLILGGAFVLTYDVPATLSKLDIKRAVVAEAKAIDANHGFTSDDLTVVSLTIPETKPHRSCFKLYFNRYCRWRWTLSGQLFWFSGKCAIGGWV
jgi:hypothetical protein